MIVAIDGRCLLEGRRGGVAQYAATLIEHVLRVAPHHKYRLFYNTWHRTPELPRFSGALEVWPFRYPNKLFNMSQWAAGAPRWDQLVPADCFFVPSFRLLPLSPTVPLVTTVHDLSFVHFPEFFSWRRRLWHRMMRPEQLLTRSTHLIAVSQATARDMQQVYGIAAGSITTIYSGVEKPTPVTTGEQQRVRQRYNLPAAFILSVGTLEPRKNNVSIIRAFEALAGRYAHDLVIVGGRGWLTHELERAWKTSPVASRIHLLGFIDAADKEALYAQAAVFVYTSFFEGFGFPPLEALLAGTPVIVSNNSSLPEVVGEYAILVNPYDVAELVLALRQELDTPRRIGAIEQEAIAEKYTWARTAQQTVAVLEHAYAHSH
jgi:glycosyltransferase involved in cell wall biosynthesis